MCYTEAMQREQSTKSKNQTANKYDHLTIEPKWQAKWQEEGVYQPNLETAKEESSEANSKGPFYNLMMFPYPSAEGLHVGNMYAFTGADVYGRFKRQQGYSVFEPIGLDGFGIHSENYALKVGTHPMDQAEKSEKNFYRQLRTIGNGYDWRHTVETYKPEYYKWTQWLFIELFKAGLAYREKSPVNFCPSCKTVLADEQVIEKSKNQSTKSEEGESLTEIKIRVCERCDTPVEKRDLEQWFFKITEYAQRLLDGLEEINWTEKIKIAQRNWIGKSEGALIEFKVQSSESKIAVFTTRPDTLHGATFLVLSPEHPFVASLLKSKIKNQKSKVEEYVEKAKAKSDDERRESKEKTGVFSEAYALNPVNNQQIPIWIADYVLMGYGTGAVMAVPAHDQRDFEFAKKYDLPLIQVISPKEQNTQLKEAYTAPGILINSGEWNGWQMPEESDKVLKSLEDKQIGKRYTRYHLRDWLISRQRYWGAPIPMIYCRFCAEEGNSWFSSQNPGEKEGPQRAKYELLNTQMKGWYPDDNLPVTLPRIDDYKPLGTGEAPLASHPEFYNIICPGCGREARRETDVSDTFLDSSWYFLRYLATEFSQIPFPSQKAVDEAREKKQQVISSKQKAVTDNELDDWEMRSHEMEEAVKRTAWLPVTSYIGGAEHSVLHLLYTRFIYKLLVDRGYLSSEKGEEPFPTFFAHGLIIKDGAKMSKSKGNVVVPDEYIAKYGADTLRTYLMFLGPFSQGGDFSDSGIEGIYRFLQRIWKFVNETVPDLREDLEGEALSQMHETIKGVTEDMQAHRYNTAIAKIMIYYNFLSREPSIARRQIEVLLQLLAPFAPHLTEELYQSMQNQPAFNSIHTSSWPSYDENVIEKGSVVIAIQINGKLRETLHLAQIEIEQSKLEKLAQEKENVKRHLEGKMIRKVIYVPGKILNFVTN